MSPLRLNDDMHLCETGGTFVVLDLARDRYWALTPDQARALEAVLAHSPSDGEARADCSTAAPLELLLAGDVLVRSPERGRPLAMTAVARPETSFLDELPPAHGRITLDRLWRFVAATRAAHGRLRSWPIGKTVAHVRSMRPSAQDSSRGGAETDLEAARELAAAFQRLRLLYPAARRCLFDSLALIEFLARYHIHPMWVFGVRLDPWTAHCWTQLGGVVLDDTLDHVVQLTPIMTV